MIYIYIYILHVLVLFTHSKSPPHTTIKHKTKENTHTHKKTQDNKKNTRQHKKTQYCKASPPPPLPLSLNSLTPPTSQTSVKSRGLFTQFNYRLSHSMDIISKRGNMCLWVGGGVIRALFRFEKDLQNIDSFRGFIEQFSLFSNRSEALLVINYM